MSERKQNFGRAIELARRCKFFVDQSCHVWTEDAQAEGSDWRAASEMRELYFSLQVVRHSSEVVLQRASLLNQ
jgi:hypothetical protein